MRDGGEWETMGTILKIPAASPMDRVTGTVQNTVTVPLEEAILMKNMTVHPEG